MKPSPCVITVLLISVLTSLSHAALVGDQNWADDVDQYTTAIQNYGWQAMDASTTWWLTGPPDASATDDYMAGWRSDTPDEYIVMHWETPLVDGQGEDLVIRYTGGPAASANVLASVDGTTYVSIGALGAAVPLVFKEVWLDFDGLLSEDVSYIKLERVANGPQTGMFFDAFGSALIQERIPGDANNDKKVDQLDAQALAENWGETGATWKMGNFNGDDVVDLADASILAANWGYGAEQVASAVPEPSTLLLLTAASPLLWRRRR